MVVDHWEAGRLGVGQRTAAAMGRGRQEQPLVPGWVVVSAAVAALPKHKQNPGTLRERAKRATAHTQHRAHKRLLPTSLRESFFPMTYSHPCESNLMTWRSI